MINPFNKPKTVQSVYDTFTKDLSAVIETQQKAADAAELAKKDLEAKLENAMKEQEAANNEVAMANNAIENISKLILAKNEPVTEEPAKEEE